MGVSAAIFESAGKRTEHYVPGAYSRSNNVTSAGGVSSGNLCILGPSAGGEPFKLLSFSNVADAKKELVSGDLLEAIGYAFNGSAEFIPSKVYAMRVNEGTKSALVLKSGESELLKVNAWDFGAHCNQLKMKIENGTNTKTYKVTMSYKGNDVITDNIIRPIMSIQYSGSGSNARVIVGVSELVLSSDVAEESVTISYENYPTVGELVAKINDTGNFVANLITTDADAKSSLLDTISNNIDTGITLYSNFAAIAETIAKNEYVSNVEYLTTSTRVVPDISSVFAYFSGGSYGNYTSEEWAKALEILEAENVQIIATPSSDDAVHALIAAHCTAMSSTVNRKERTCILGGPLDMSDSDAITKAAGFNNKLVSFVSDTVTASNPITGEAERINGAMVACMLAGMESSMGISEPLTNKALNILAVSKNRSISNMETLIQAGVLLVNASPDNPTALVCIRAMTTFQGDDLIQNERSMVREDLYMNRDLRAAFTPAIGKPNNFGTSVIVATLKDRARQWAESGYIVRSNTNEAVWNISVSIDGDKIYLRYSRYLTAPTNFVFITATNHIYTNTVEI